MSTTGKKWEFNDYSVVDDCGNLIATIHDETCEGDEEFDERGRLLAASPELLDVLSAITFAAKMDCPRNKAWVNLLRECDRIISKAKGEANV